MVVIAIIAILALHRPARLPDKFVRDQIVDAVKLADIAKAPIAAAWAAAGTLPVDNAAAGLPPADMIVNNYISSVAVESGAIQITFGNRANANIHGKMLTLRPAVVEGTNWCRWPGSAATPRRREHDRQRPQQDQRRAEVPAAQLPIDRAPASERSKSRPRAIGAGRGHELDSR